MLTRKLFFYFGVFFCFASPMNVWAETVQLIGYSWNDIDKTISQKVIALTELFLTDNDYEVVEKKSSIQAVVNVKKNSLGYVVIELKKKINSQTVNQEERIIYNDENLDIAIKTLVNRIFEKGKVDVVYLDNKENEDNSTSPIVTSQPAQLTRLWLYRTFDLGYGGSLLFPLLRYNEMANVGLGAGWFIRLGVSYALHEYLSFPIMINAAESRLLDQPQHHLSFNAGVRFYWGNDYHFFLNPYIGIGLNRYNESVDNEYDDYDDMTVSGYNFGLECGHRFVKWKDLDISAILSYEATVNSYGTTNAKMANTISAFIQISLVSGRE